MPKQTFDPDLYRYLRDLADTAVLFRGADAAHVITVHSDDTVDSITGTYLIIHFPQAADGQDRVTDLLDQESASATYRPEPGGHLLDGTPITYTVPPTEEG